MPALRYGKQGKSMVYKVVVTEHAENLIDKLINYILYNLKNRQAAKHLLDGIESVYDRLGVNPYQFPICRDMYLARKGYREAIVPQMKYIIVFGIQDDVVNVVGVFHQLEAYEQKL